MCAFKKPTEKGVREAIEFGWSEEDAKRGYTIFNYDGLGLLEIEVIGDCYNDSGYCDDEEAAHEAERSGFCKIIPVDELPETFEANGHTVRWFGWVDTPENRKAIENYAGRKHNSILYKGGYMNELAIFFGTSSIYFDTMKTNAKDAFYDFFDACDHVGIDISNLFCGYNTVKCLLRDSEFNDIDSYIERSAK